MIFEFLIKPRQCFYIAPHRERAVLNCVPREAHTFGTLSYNIMRRYEQLDNVGAPEASRYTCTIQAVKNDLLNCAQEFIDFF